MTGYELISSCTSCSGTLAVLITLVFIARQTNEMAQQSKAAAKAAIGSPHDRVAAQMQAMDMVFIDHPHMRAYFYAAKPIDAASPDYNLAVSIAELRLDFLDQVVAQARLFPDDWKLDRWRDHIVWSLRQSPVMARHLEALSFSYSETLLDCLRESQAGPPVGAGANPDGRG